MSLEEIEEIRKDLKELIDPREINVKEASESVFKIRIRYNNLLKEKGKDYCNENCPDIPLSISRLLQDLAVYH